MLVYTDISDDSISRGLTESSASHGPVRTTAAQSATTLARCAHYRVANVQGIQHDVVSATAILHAAGAR
jgi:hypothetical protein